MCFTTQLILTKSSLNVFRPFRLISWARHKQISDTNTNKRAVSTYHVTWVRLYELKIIKISKQCSNPMAMR